MNHRWDYHGTDPYSARRKTCLRCGITATTFGVGSGRWWSYRDRDGHPVGTTRPECRPAPLAIGDWK
jgi:hypothetical protein